jgi:N-acetyl-anhydromuramoyl-L-alanine amidase
MLSIDRHGYTAGIPYIPSPNCDERPPGATIDLVVIHNISLPPGEFAGPGIVDLFLNRLDPSAHPYFETIAHLKVSAHFLVRRDGELIQFVPCGMRAWHAGASAWRGRERCNDYSIGIEVEGADDQPFTDIQYERLAAVMHALRVRYGVHDLAGHSDVAPGRKTDPGPCFDWERLRQLLRTA